MEFPKFGDSDPVFGESQVRFLAGENFRLVLSSSHVVNAPVDQEGRQLFSDGSQHLLRDPAGDLLRGAAGECPGSHKLGDEDGGGEHFERVGAEHAQAHHIVFRWNSIHRPAESVVYLLARSDEENFQVVVPVVGQEVDKEPCDPMGPGFQHVRARREDTHHFAAVYEESNVVSVDVHPGAPTNLLVLPFPDEIVFMSVVQFNEHSLEGIISENHESLFHCGVSQVSAWGDSRLIDIVSRRPHLLMRRTPHATPHCLPCGNTAAPMLKHCSPISTA